MNSLSELEYADYVTVNGVVYFVNGTNDKNGTALLVPAALLDTNAADEMALMACAQEFQPRQINAIVPVKVEPAIVQSLFRLETTPWQLALEGKYPFSSATAKYSFTEEDMMCFLENLRKVDSDIIIDTWCSNFSSGFNDFARWPKMIEPGFTFSFFCGCVWRMMGWIESVEDEWDYIYDLRDCYLQSKNRPLSEMVIPDDYRGDMLSSIEQFAKKNPVTDKIKAFYISMMDVAALDDLGELKRKAYAYYGGNGIVPCDWAKSAEALDELFYTTGDAHAANSLGYIYYSSRLGKPDYEKAFFYFTQAADCGIVEATYKLSDMYRHGHGTDHNPTKAWELLCSLYEKIDKKKKWKWKYPDICLRMGYCYRDGIGVDADKEKAYYYFTEAKIGIEERIEKDKGFGDEVVLKNILEALSTLL